MVYPIDLANIHPESLLRDSNINDYMDGTPYTYLIGWSKLDKWYYGVRYAKSCHPSDLWHPYKTSSKIVHEFVEHNGAPDVIQVRRTFSNADSARNFEYGVLHRMRVVESPRWLNLSDSKSICPIKAYEGVKYKPTREEARVNALKQISDGIHPFAKLVTCPFCQKTGQNANMKRWHFDRCKFR